MNDDCKYTKIYIGDNKYIKVDTADIATLLNYYPHTVCNEKNGNLLNIISNNDPLTWVNFAS